MNFVSAAADDKAIAGVEKTEKQRNRAAFNGHLDFSMSPKPHQGCCPQDGTAHQLLEWHNKGLVSAGEGIPGLSGHLCCSHPALRLLPFPSPDWSLQRQEQRESKDTGSARLQIVRGTCAKSRASPENV